MFPEVDGEMTPEHRDEVNKAIEGIMQAVNTAHGQNNIVNFDYVTIVAMEHHQFS